MKSLLNLKKCFAAAVALVFAGSIMAQSITVTGTVKDTSGEALMGVTVIVDGTTTGTATGIDGTYSIRVPNASSVLRFSYMGYADQTISVGNQTKIDVVLAEDATAMEDVIVIGYGTVRKSDITGAVSHIGSEEIKERPVQNALQAMQGKMPGVDITTESRPGALGEIRIRGNRSLNASNAPLYVVDGIPVGSGVGTGPNTSLIGEHEYSQTAGSIADINPADIESIDILKDASATAIYGSRGANGVILITTKKGEKGRTRINYDGTVTFTRVKSLTDWMTSGEKIDYQRQAYINAGTYEGNGARYGNAPDPLFDYQKFVGNWEYMIPAVAMAYQLNNGDIYNPVLRDATPEEIAKGYAAKVPVYDSSKWFDNDWTEYVTRVAKTHNHQISVSGGNETTRFYASAAYLNQESTNKDQDYERFTFNANGEVKATKWFTMGMSNNLSYSIQDYGIMNNLKNGGAKDSYGQALNLSRLAPTFADADGNPVWVTGRENEGKYALFTPGRDQGPSGHNMLNNIDKAFNENRAWSFMNSTYLEIQVMEGLRWRTNFGAQYRTQRNGRYYAPGWTNPQGVTDSDPGWGYYGTTLNLSWTLENLIYYDKTWGKHSLSATLLQSAEQFRTELSWMRLQGLTYETAKWFNASANSLGKPQSYSTGYSETSIASYMARLNYSFDDKYLLTLTGRYDGSSVLAPGNKWDFFPSASLAWRIDQENFMQSQTLFSQLKLRAGYGVTGNSSVSAYSTSGTMVTQDYLFDTTTSAGAKAQIIPTPNLGWEKTGQYKIGSDNGFLQNRIAGSIEYYNATTTDLLMSQSIPFATGYNSFNTNLGKTRNSGIEISLTSYNIERKDFQWSTTFSFSANREQVVETQYGKMDDEGMGLYIGQPMSTYYTYTYDRLWQDTAEDRRMIAIYNAIGGTNYIPGQGVYVDRQDMILASQATADQIAEYGTVSKNISYTDDSGATVTESIEVLDNGFGKFDREDYTHIGTLRPKWVGGLTNNLTYKNFTLSFYLYARIGSMYNTMLQTLGSRKIDDSEFWSKENPNGKYAQPLSGIIGITDNSGQMAYQKASFVSVRNISLSYNLPERIAKKLSLSSAQIYGQVLNPFIFGGELVKAGINPDDDGKGQGSNAQTNNTAINQSFVVGLRLSL